MAVSLRKRLRGDKSSYQVKSDSYIKVTLKVMKIRNRVEIFSRCKVIDLFMFRNCIFFSEQPQVKFKVMRTSSEG